LNYNPYPFPFEGENTPGFQNVVYETKDGGKSPNYRVQHIALYYHQTPARINISVAPNLKSTAPSILLHTGTSFP
jgi:hypothetical protein